MQNVLSRRESIEKLFSSTNKTDIYNTLLSLSKETNPLDKGFQDERNRVIGCQSQMFVYATNDNSKIYFTIYSDALISRGIGALLAKIYNGLTAEEILKLDIAFLKDLGITSSLSLTRSNGLSALNLKIKSLALGFIEDTIKRK